MLRYLAVKISVILRYNAVRNLNPILDYRIFMLFSIFRKSFKKEVSTKCSILLTYAINFNYFKASFRANEF